MNEGKTMAEEQARLEEEIARLGAALSQQQHRFDTLFQELKGVAIQGYRPDGTVTLWNDANTALYGWTPEEAVGRDIVDLIIPDDLRDFVRAAIAAGARGEPMPPAGEMLLQHKDGHLVPVYTSHAVVMHPDREPDMFCIDLDMRDLRRAERELRRLRRETELHREKERRVLAGWLHDDLGQDVAVLTMDCDWLRGTLGPQPPTIQERMDSIAEGLGNLSRKLRDVATELRPSTLDHFGLAIALGELVSRMAEKSGLRTTTRLEEGVDLGADPNTALYRMAQELVTNIVRHASASAMEASLTQDAESVVLSVKDDGCGFERDSLDLTRTFGLSNIADRVREMGGAMTLHSLPGEGTQVILTIPRDGPAN